MMMFGIGFLCAWFILAAFVYFVDGANGGICLFGGWACYVLLLPFIPFGVLIEWIQERRKKVK